MFLLNKNWYIVGEGFTPPEENEAITRRVILSLSNPKGAAGGISSAHKTNSAEGRFHYKTLVL